MPTSSSRRNVANLLPSGEKTTPSHSPLAGWRSRRPVDTSHNRKSGRAEARTLPSGEKASPGDLDITGAAENLWINLPSGTAPQANATVRAARCYHLPVRRKKQTSDGEIVPPACGPQASECPCRKSIIGCHDGPGGLIRAGQLALRGPIRCRRLLWLGGLSREGLISQYTRAGREQNGQDHERGRFQLDRGHISQRLLGQGRAPSLRGLAGGES